MVKKAAFHFIGDFTKFQNIVDLAWSGEASEELVEDLKKIIDTPNTTSGDKALIMLALLQETASVFMSKFEGAKARIRDEMVEEYIKNHALMSRAASNAEIEKQKKLTAEMAAKEGRLLRHLGEIHKMASDAIKKDT